MSLDLDDRQRAILQEMGVHVWWPQTATPVPAAVALPSVQPPTPRVVPPPARTAPVPSVVDIESVASNKVSERARASNAVHMPAPATAAPAPGVLVEGIAAMDWATLADAVANCQACKLSVGRRAPVFGGADAIALPDAVGQADWLVLGEPPDEAEERAGVAFADQVGQLLDNMLKAVGVRRQVAGSVGSADSRARTAYVSNIVKCRPAPVRNPMPQELATCENYLKREVALVQPKVILAMGRFAAQTLLQGSVPEVASIPLGKLRGQVYRYQGIAVVVTYHPSYLLRTQQDKARAWADLCLAQAQCQQPL